MKILLLIFLGGGIGSVLRYLLSSATLALTSQSFPYGTLSVNILGSFIMGLLFVILTQKIAAYAMELRAFLLIGCLGGFTTFSSFAIETLNLFENGESLRALAYIIFSFIFCLVAVFCGALIGRQL